MTQPTITEKQAIRALSRLLDHKTWNPTRFASLFEDYSRHFGWDTNETPPPEQSK